MKTVSLSVTFILLSWSWTNVVSFQDVQDDRFLSAGICGVGWEGYVMQKSGVRSNLECLARCGRTSGCEAAILVTSSDAGEKSCHLLAAHPNHCFASSSGHPSKLWKRVRPSVETVDDDISSSPSTEPTGTILESSQSVTVSPEVTSATSFSEVTSIVASSEETTFASSEVTSTTSSSEVTSVVSSSDVTTVASSSEVTSTTSTSEVTPVIFSSVSLTAAESNVSVASDSAATSSGTTEVAAVSSAYISESSIVPSSSTTESATTTVQTTTVAPCANGGTWVSVISAMGAMGATGGSCLCVEGFTGQVCERRWKDCTEGQQLSSYTLQGHYFIQPTSAPSAFEVYCSGRLTYIHYRNQITTSTCGPQDFFKNWTDYKNGFGRYPCDLWLGNEQLYHLTNQGRYYLEVRVTIKGDSTGRNYSSQYEGFLVESEQKDYRLTLGPHTTSDLIMKDGFGQSTPTSTTSLQARKFGTPDYDTTGCAALTRSGWWFNLNCSVINLNVPEGSFPPGIQPLAWPMKNTQLEVVRPAMLIYAMAYY